MINWTGNEKIQKQDLTLKGNKVTIDKGVTLNMDKMFSQPLGYSTKEILTFKNEDQATEFYYKILK